MPAEILSSLLELARRAPAAGKTAAVEFLVLSTSESVERYWNTTLTVGKRKAFAFPGLISAPVLVVVLTRPEAYTERYAEADKSHTGLGLSTDSWPVPYWWVDAGAVIQNLLLLVQNYELAACLFGLFEHEEAILENFAVPPDRRAVGTIALGFPADDPSRAGRSAGRKRPNIESITHWDMWTAASEGSP